MFARAAGQSEMKSTLAHRSILIEMRYTARNIPKSRERWTIRCEWNKRTKRKRYGWETYHRRGRCRDCLGWSRRVGGRKGQRDDRTSERGRIREGKEESDRMGKGKWDTKGAQGWVCWASLRPSAGNQILMEWE